MSCIRPQRCLALVFIHPYCAINVVFPGKTDVLDTCFLEMPIRSALERRRGGRKKTIA